MNLRKGKIYIAATVLLLLTGIASGQPTDESALQTVKEFYRLHFLPGSKMYFEPKYIRSRRKWLTPALYRLMLYEFRREAAYAKAHPDLQLKPYFSGDVFTDAESLPQVFRVTSVRQEKNKAIVTVWVYWNDNTVGKMKRKIRVVLLQSQTQWLIDNLLYEDGKDLVTQLKRPSYY